MNWKEFSMKWFWRLQQVSGIASMAMWIAGLTVLSGNLVMGCVLGIGALGFAWWFDKQGKLWKEQNQVSADRNQFCFDQPYEKEVHWSYPINRVMWVSGLELYRLLEKLFKDEGFDITAFHASIKEYEKEMSRMMDYYEHWREEYGKKTV